MNDMSSVIAPKSDQLNSDDLIAGPRTIRIRDVAIRPGTEQPVSIFFDGDNNKPWKPCKTASRVLVSAWGADANVYRGRAATIYRDPEVTWGGMKVGGIRISALSDIERPLVIALTEKKGSKKIATIQPLKAEVVTIGLTIDDARKLIAGAADMDTLRNLWSSSDMRPFRHDLKADLDDRKAALEFQPEGPADTDRGARTDADDLIDLYGRAATEAAIAEADKAANALNVDDPDVAAARADAVARVAS